MTAPAASITIGNFDGVHRGHQSLIDLTANVARQRQQRLKIITFWPHPRTLIRGKDAHQPLTTREKRLQLLTASGVEDIVEVPFTQELMRLSPEEFICQHLLPLGIKSLVIGHDFTLGRDRQGNAKELAQLAHKFDFDLIQAPPFCLDGLPISSTRLRKALIVGDVGIAAAMLGRWHLVCGEVTHGAGRGAQLGFPTANISSPEVMLPANGVYATFVRSENQIWPAVTNIGCNPTFAAHSLTVESFLLDADVNLYGRTICIDFVARLREERKFPSQQALVAQITADIAQARAILASPPLSWC